MLLTPLYAAVFGLFFVFLSFRTVALRRKYRASLGGGQQPLLERAIRVHGNFAEYVPYALLLIYFVEAQTAYRPLIHFLCGLLLAARLSHAYGVSQVTEQLRFRIFGMVATGVVIVVSAVVLLGHGLL